MNKYSHRAGNSLLKKLKDSIPAQKEAAALVGYAPFQPPFRYDEMGGCIFDNNNNMVVEIRGWGYLTGQGGGLGYEDEKASDIQNKVGERIAKIMTDDVGA